MTACDSAPKQTTTRPEAKAAPAAGAAETTVIDFRMDGRSAIPNPDPEDVGWKDEGYAKLKPSNEDGQPTFSNTWFLSNHGDFWKALSPLKGKPNLRYLEVGVYEGQAFLWVFKNILTHPSSSGVAIDVFLHKDLETRFRENLERAGIVDRVTTLVGYSNDMLRPLEKETFDVIYVDASHTADNVLRDAVLSWDLLKPGGVLIFDDYAYRPAHPAELRPKEALDGFITAFRNELEVIKRGWHLTVKKKENPCPGCSTLGPYCYHWNDSAIGVLFDPRTNARVPLTYQEAQVIEMLLRSRSFGKVEYVLPEAVAQRPDVLALRKKLGF